MKNATISERIQELYSNPEFLRLKEIGGHKVYHLEGDALVHTGLVISAAKNIWGENSLMVLVAALHDVGKIYSSICNGPNDWTYPGHAKAGADNLEKFLDKDDVLYEVVYWFVSNHIKPLFWHKSKNLEKDLEAIMATSPDLSICNLKNLALLALCDIKGSIGVESVNPAEDFLKKFVKEH